METTWTDCPCVRLIGEKTGAILLLLGIFLCLVGSVFTITGLLDYTSGTSMEWLLGPIMLSVGGAFMLISMCSFGMYPCLIYRLTGEGAEEEEAEEQRGELRRQDPATTGRSFVFNSVQHPMVFHCATVATQFNPPPYDSLAPQHHQRHQQHQQHSVGETQAGGPPSPCFYHLFPGENAAFTGENGFPLGRGHLLTRQTRSRLQDGQQGEKKDEGNSSTCSPPPPAYEDIYPV